MSIAYQIVLLSILIIGGPYLLIRAIIGGHGLKERLGFWKFIADDRKTVWFHAASMGELKVINSILPQLLIKNPDLRIAISTITKTGKTEAVKLFHPIEVFYLPLDLQCCVNRVIRKVKPSLLILVETEIWPILIRQTALANAKIVIVNARLSRKSFRFYRLFKSFISSVLDKIEFIMTQTEKDSTRFIHLGAGPQKVEIYGNTKFDQVLIENAKPPAQELVNFLNHDDKFVFIAGSVRPGEYEAVLTAVKAALMENIKLKAVIAPRHMKDIFQLETTLKTFGLSYVKRSDLPGKKSNESVLIIDTMGELRGLYSYANLAFVGGSLVKIGGHDPLEPASAGCMVCFGPYMENTRLFADILVEAGGAAYINDSDELSGLIIKLAKEPDMAGQLGEIARQTVSAHAGASAKTARKLAEFV